ncbi:unnamed protein product [Symbiodinium sp. CCMP2592]|nr:unnamed protein product [Symbiodinium sp. CCMP2592]
MAAGPGASKMGGEPGKMGGGPPAKADPSSDEESEVAEAAAPSKAPKRKHGEDEVKKTEVQQMQRPAEPQKPPTNLARRVGKFRLDVGTLEIFAKITPFDIPHPKAAKDDAKIEETKSVAAAKEVVKDEGEVKGEPAKEITYAGMALLYAGPEMRADREVVLAAVRQDGCALLCASQALRMNREVVQEAVRQNGLALQQASEELQADPELRREAEEAESRLGHPRRRLESTEKEHGRPKTTCWSQLGTSHDFISPRRQRCEGYAQQPTTIVATL